MAPSSASAELSPGALRSNLLVDLFALTKPRLSSLVMATAAGGMWLAPGEIAPARRWVTLAAIAGTVGAANALNCYAERDRDRLMSRTRNRPLPSGRMEPAVALFFGLWLAVFSVPLLALVANPLTGLLGLVALVSYVFAYTPLKSRSWVAMWVGAVPGALPPLMGWTTLTGKLDAGGLVLFGILFFWQLPHFIAIALFRKKEYAAAGFTSVPLAMGNESARRQLFWLTAMLFPVSLLLYPLHVSGALYLVSAVALGGPFVWMAGKGLWGDPGARWAKRVFLYSLTYLAGLFLALTVDALIR
jgi:protoheme IX farnesyltransferase